MCDLEKWMEKNKKLCVVTGMFGLLVSPFLWPLFLAIIFQSLSLAVPIILAWAFIKHPWNGKEKSDEEMRKGMQYDEEADAGKVSSDGTQADDIPKRREKKGEKTVKEQAAGKKMHTPDEAYCLVLLWYQKEGRERILRMKKKLEEEGRKEFSVSKDGICSVRKEKGFERVGILRGYPGSKIALVAKELKKDGLSIKISGDYTWISWKKGGAAHAL